MKEERERERERVRGVKEGKTELKEERITLFQSYTVLPLLPSPASPSHLLYNHFPPILYS